MARKHVVAATAVVLIIIGAVVIVERWEKPTQGPPPRAGSAPTPGDAVPEAGAGAGNGEALAEWESELDAELRDDSLDEIVMNLEEHFRKRRRIDWEERKELTRQLSALSSEDLLAVYMALLDEADDEERILTVKFAHSIPDNALAPFYEKALSDANGRARAAALQTLVSGGMDTPEVIKRATEIAISDSSAYARKEAAHYFDRLSRRQPELIDDTIAQALAEIAVDPAIKGEHWDYGRLCAVRALSRTSVGPETIIPLLEEVIEQGSQGGKYDLTTVMAAAAALARRDKATFDVKAYLLDNLESTAEHGNVRAACISGLAIWADDDNVRDAVRRAVVLEPATIIWTTDVYDAAGEFWKATRDEKLTEECLRMLNSLSGRHRRHLAAALAQMGRKEGPLMLLDFVTEPPYNGPFNQQAGYLRMLREATGQDFGYKPFAPPEDRQEPLEKWRRFIDENYRSSTDLE